ncbi:MAG: MFS transporter, partial [Rhodospirillaceae bacterium]|nr:MFS transporter [Rhodospirillaceae bacterium]
MTTAELDRPVTKRGLAAWCLFDWANSPTPTVVVTFVFAPYFARGIVGNEAEGLALWSWGIAFSALVIAVLAPVTGAIADAAGRRKPWIAGFSLLTILATAGLWFCAPDPTWIFPTLILVALVNIGFETSTVFY